MDNFTLQLSLSNVLKTIYVMNPLGELVDKYESTLEIDLTKRIYIRGTYFISMNTEDTIEIMKVQIHQ